MAFWSVLVAAAAAILPIVVRWCWPKSSGGAAVAAGENIGVLVRVDPQAVGVPNASCLDGSPPAYYYRPQPSGPNRTKWLLYFQGGGWCSLHEGAWPTFFRPSLVEHCSHRAKRAAGSTQQDVPSVDFSYKGLFSQDPKVNPTMHDWNVVLLRYCDGSSFASRAPRWSPPDGGAELHFEGLANLQAILARLMSGASLDGTPPSLKEASEVVVSGCSAGGVAAALHLERVRELLPHASVVGLLDSAIFPDWSTAGSCSSTGASTDVARGGPVDAQAGNLSCGERPDCIWPLQEQLRWIFERFGLAASGAVPQACLEAHASTGSWRCFFVEHLLPVVTEHSPVFVLQSRFDSSNVQRLQWNGLEHFGKEVSGRLEATRSQAANSLSRAPVGLFLDACFHHCMKWSEISIEGTRQPDAFAAFMGIVHRWRASHGASTTEEQNTNVSQIWLRQAYEAGQLPCKECCHLPHKGVWKSGFEQTNATEDEDTRYWRRTFSEIGA